jgi:hypothetical protein
MSLSFSIRRSAWAAASSALLAAACGTSQPQGPARGSGGGAAGTTNTGAGGSLIGVPGIDGSIGTTGSLSISPADPSVVVTIVDGQVMTSTVSFTATDAAGAVRPGWSIDQGAIGSITPDGVFTPSGTVGGTVHVLAGVGGSSASTTITVVIHRTQNGFVGPIDLTGSGGYGGVGGEGPGGPVSAGDHDTLGKAPTPDPSRAWLYPYDATVWPRGLLAPLLQWTTGKADATAIALHLESSTFVYDGTFARPAALSATAPFVRHPIPQDVWQQATESTAGTDPLKVSVVLLQGGVAVGPLTQTWHVAPGLLQGTVYYESYGTQLVKNSDFVAQGGGYVGAAVLSIHPGDDGPRVAAGSTTPAASLGSGVGCRACHSVAAKGGNLIVEDDKYPYSQSSLYNLQTLNETLVSAPPQFGPPFPMSWAALSPDGTFALTNSVWMGTDTDNRTELFRLDAAGRATAAPTDALVAGLKGATPTFSPDGAHVAFTHVAGTLGSLVGDSTHVVTLDFDPMGPAFSNPKNVFALPSSPACVGFPSFLPTNNALLVQLTLMACGTGATAGNTSFGQYVGTSKAPGAPGLPSEIWWTDVASSQQHRLDALNGYNSDGTSYLPAGPNGHGADTKLNYEPTVAPTASGGYAWVIFTSRRMYGNVATIDPFSSDPRSYDYLHQVTTKKLWVAAVDLSAPPGTDPSHPGFYLPAQELQSGNARGFWVLEPCRNDGASCEFGDQCCGGYCQPAGGNGNLVCANTSTTCSRIGDKCTVDKDCCDVNALCINSVCSLSNPIVK